MKRVHRTFWERFNYLAIYECRDCHAEEFIPRRFRFHLGDNCMCPRCGTLRITKLRDRDQIDPMMGGLLNIVERMAGGKIYHCCYCRVQFYDRRKMASRTDSEPAETAAEGFPPPLQAKPSE
jgi:hypothetical protein